MAQNNIEKEFSNKLNDREIQPSPMAWDRLDAMLTVAEQKKAAKKYNWLYVAAGFLGFLFIGTFLFTQTEEMTDGGRNGIVIEDAIKDSLKATPNPEAIKPVYENRIQNTVVAAEEKIKSKPIIKNEPAPVSQKQIVNQDQINQNAIAEHESQPQQNQSINQKTEQIKKSIYVNVDELLASVDKAPKTKEPTVKVDSNGLLSQVDGELELSFREKVIKAVNKNYKTVRVALSNRNVQQ